MMRVEKIWRRAARAGCTAAAMAGMGNVTAGAAPPARAQQGIFRVAITQVVSDATSGGTVSPRPGDVIGPPGQSYQPSGGTVSPSPGGTPASRSRTWNLHVLTARGVVVGGLRLTQSGSGAFTGALRIQSRTFRFAGQFDRNGAFQRTFDPRSRLPTSLFLQQSPDGALRAAVLKGNVTLSVR